MREVRRGHLLFGAFPRRARPCGHLDVAAVNHDEPGGAFWVRGGVLERDVATPRVTDNHRAFDLQNVHERFEVGNHGGEIVSVVRLRAFAVPALVKGVDVEALR